ncbi:MAG TPA: GNAT family protein [Flavobacteriaceae bacterium]|nr:GNAT family protein [Flavobacteriaceae bacterium]|tara:strand:+ start:4085 stop:4606 length:522 start_codon:yes stop_codon:yes gene_type:complete
MEILKGKNIFLRALEPEDLDYLFSTENNEDIWEISSTSQPFSRHILSKYIEKSHLDIYQVNQLRLVISDYKNNSLGLIDLFDVDFKNFKAGIGILINKDNRDKGHAKEALEILIKYCFAYLNLHQLYCNIIEENKASISLFKNLGFNEIGLKKDWIYFKGEYKNEYLFQLTCT